MILRGWRGTAETFAAERHRRWEVRIESSWPEWCALRGTFPERLIDANPLDL